MRQFYRLKFRHLLSLSVCHRTRGHAAMNSATSGSSGHDRMVKTFPKQVTQMSPRGYTINPPALDRPVRVYVHGVFDLFHVGSVAPQEQCVPLITNFKLQPFPLPQTSQNSLPKHHSHRRRNRRPRHSQSKRSDGNDGRRTFRSRPRMSVGGRSDRGLSAGLAS